MFGREGAPVGRRASSLRPATHTLGMAFAYSQVVYPNAVIDARFAVSFGLPFFLLLSYLEPFNEQRQCPFNRQSLLAPN